MTDVLRHWHPGVPDKAGYYLVTCAPVNHAEISLERAQDYAEDTGSSLAWYNPTNGWWRKRPGMDRTVNINHLVTHWAERPPGARPTAEQLAALPKEGWVSWWGMALRDISRALVFQNYDEALDLIENQLIPQIKKEQSHG